MEDLYWITAALLAASVMAVNAYFVVIRDGGSLSYTDYAAVVFLCALWPISLAALAGAIIGGSIRWLAGRRTNG